jgi:hypothetical protein
MLVGREGELHARVLGGDLRLGGVLGSRDAVQLERLKGERTLSEASTRRLGRRRRRGGAGGQGGGNVALEEKS